MDKRSVFYSVENRLHGVVHGEDEAGGKLPQFFSGVHQGGRVGEEIKTVHELEKFVFYSFNVILRFIIKLRRGDGTRHAAEHFFRCFGHLAFAVPQQIASFQYLQSGIGKAVG